jgi:RimJ/RimL family protein N-acetyltransferase
MPNTIFQTPRLSIRPATLADTEMYFRLWTEPRVMHNVGFPHGLRITKAEIQQKIAEHSAKQGAFNRLLVAVLLESRAVIGECKMYTPNEEGISETDVKLLPEYWGNKYGVEIKRGLVDYLFTHTTCQIVQATPNVNNHASIKMQEAVGGMRVGEEVFEFPEEMQAFTTPVHVYIYHVQRATWEQLKAKREH